jgi:hypothetical protein
MHRLSLFSVPLISSELIINVCGIEELLDFPNKIIQYISKILNLIVVFIIVEQK